MKVVIQKVLESSVRVDNKCVASINKGLMVLVGFTHKDTIDDIKYIVNKILNLRIFEDNNNIMNLSVKDINGEILSVSQFTLYANTLKGNRPSYIDALDKDKASILYNLFNEELEKSGINIKKGIFHADMKVSLINDGPTTIVIER